MTYHGSTKAHRLARLRRLGVGVLTATLSAVACSWLLPGASAAQAGARTDVAEEKGTLPDGTVFLMRMPATWNKTLIRDLDYANAPDSPRYQSLIARGYAVAGTQRHRLRAYQYDPAREIANLNVVLDRFEARFGKPSRVIQFGCSGGGHVTLAVAEDFADRVHGAVALAAHTPVWLMNTFLDGWFTLEVLIAPDLPVVNLPPGQQYNPTGHGVEGTVPDAWRRAIDAAQQTPAGRARIALAFTIGQWPAWVNQLTPQPSPDDVPALQHSMYHTVFQNASNPGGEARFMFENAANGQQLSWNTDVDYAALFESGNEAFKRAVHLLYAEAGLDLAADLAKVNASPRVAASPHALAFWNAPGRTVRGDIKIPLLRLHEVGDHQVPMSLVQGYDGEVRARAKESLYRTAFVNGDGHCRFTAAETTAAIETMMRRLDTGVWDSTTPDAMNARAATLNTGSPSRFTGIDRFLQKQYNRVWRPE